MEAIAQARQQGIPAGRCGDPAEFGELCAYVCSARAAYITGQKLLTGGAYPGTLIDRSRGVFARVRLLYCRALAGCKRSERPVRY